jgi:hypothetical protein
MILRSSFILLSSMDKSCFIGSNQQIEPAIQGISKQSNHGHKMAFCSICGNEGEVRYLIGGVCGTCTKVKAKTATNAPTSGLSAAAL